jgi:hypothetical protein
MVQPQRCGLHPNFAVYLEDLAFKLHAVACLDVCVGW